jgi:hypothetical protein
MLPHCQTFVNCYIGATTFSILTLSIMAFSIMSLSIKGLYATLSMNDFEHNRHSA